MSTYTPDGWSIIKISQVDEDGPLTHRVLADWFETYLTGAEWRLSSGITSVVKEGSQYVVTNHSGSIYYLNERTEDSLGSYGRYQLAHFQTRLGAENFQVVSIKDLLK